MADATYDAIVIGGGNKGLIVAMYLARVLTDQSYRQIGRYFGGRDHTTILHGFRKTEQLIKIEPQIQKAILDLQEKLANP